MEVERRGGYIKGDSIAETSLGMVYRALPIEGAPSIVLLHRVASVVASNERASELIERNAEKWSGVKDLHALNLLDFERDGVDLYFVTETRQGRLLSQVLERCRLEQMGLSPDQAVYIVERAAQSVASLATHGVKCGCLSPERILLTFEGEVALLPCVFKDIQSVDWTGKSPFLPLLKYLPPEAAEGKVSDARTDVYSLGALFFQLLTGEGLAPEEGEFDAATRIKEAAGGIGVYGPLSESLLAVLKGALLTDDPASFKNVDAMKEALGQLISSGEYGPTTFNMAFLMHSLFREEEGQDSAEDRELLAMDREPWLRELDEARKPPESEPPTAAPSVPASSAPTLPPVAETSDIFHEDAEPAANRNKLFMILGIVVAMVAVIVGTWFFFLSPTGPSKETLAKQALEKKLAEERAKSAAQQAELAKRLQATEDEKNALEEKLSKATTAKERRKARQALDAARTKLEEQKRKMTPAAVAHASKTATPSETKAAAPPAEKPPGGKASPKAAPSGPAATPAAPSKTSVPGPAAEKKTPPAVKKKVTKAGDFVEAWALDVKPKRLNDLRVHFTSVARRHNVHGTIYVAANISEDGKVSDVKIVRPLSPDFGMNEACRAATMKLKYSPAIKDGVPVKTRITFPVKIE